MRVHLIGFDKACSQSLSFLFSSSWETVFIFPERKIRAAFGGNFCVAPVLLGARQLVIPPARNDYEFFLADFECGESHAEIVSIVAVEFDQLEDGADVSEKSAAAIAMNDHWSALRGKIF